MFRLGPDQPCYHVGHLFQNIDPDKLVVQGQYGVQIIPSCDNLGLSNPLPPDAEQLAAVLSSSKLGGVVIIDTCPILDAYTRNALFAADRVIVPVKDAPSLENCRHLARFFSDQGISPSPLRLLPCLIDTRIRYKGPFSSSYQLVKAYAINRGYRCFEGFIAKSPKVESLATNPEGKVYPILTHGRATEVHLQFNHLARQVYLEYLEKGPTRMREISTTRDLRAELNDRRQQERRQRLADYCLCCRQPLPQAQTGAAFYVESSNREICGFIEENCFYEMIFDNLFARPKGAISSAIRDIFEETALRSYFVLQRPEPTKIALIRLDPRGETLSHRISEIKSTAGFLRRQTPLLQNLLNQALPDGQSRQMLLIKHCPAPNLQILEETAYARFQAIFSRARLDYGSEPEELQGNAVFP
jgi:hypothetical protein